jgi:hypothetical protein
MTEPGSRPSLAGWIVAGLMLLVAAGAGVYAANLKIQLDDATLRLVDVVTKLQVSEGRATDASQELTAMRASLALLGAPDAADFKLVGKGAGAQASGRVFVSRSKGLLFSASKLPPLAEGSTYQLWLLTRGGAASAGVVHPGEEGNIVAAFDPLPDAPDPTGFAVSVEPEGGSSKPTGTMYLATP